MNAASWRGLVLTLVVTLLIAAGAGFVGARLGMQRADTASSGPMGGGTVRQSVHTLLDKSFKLSDAQKQRIQAIDERFTRQHNLIWGDIRMYNAQLASAVATDMSLNPQAQAAIKNIQQSVGALHTESILYVLEVRKVLTPEQQTVFDEHIVLALMRDPA
ncbi:MAG: periplasmic heavy metal sensor [Caulobacteraceae bacterium]